MSEFVLVIAQQATFLYQLKAAKAERVAKLPVSEDLSQWLALHLPEHSDCSLVTDIMDESYVQSTLPPLWMPATRLQLLERRLSQQLRDTPYRAAVLSPSGSYKPPTRAVFIGMGQSERIKECVALLAAHQTRLKGLWPMSALIAVAANSRAFKKFQPKNTSQDKARSPASILPTLALAATPTGLRQVLVIGKTPLFSRLSAGTIESVQSAENALNEARRTVQYLISQQWLLEADQPIATRLWLPAQDKEALASAADDAALDVQVLTPIEDAYVFLLPLVKQALPNLQLLPAANLLQWRAAQIGRAAIAIGIAALALATLWSAQLAWDAWSKNKMKGQQLQQAAAINLQARQEVLQAKGDLSQAGLAVVTVQAWQKSIEAQPDQAAAMRHLAAALQAAPGLTLEKMRWDLPGGEPETPGTPAATFGCPPSPSAAAQAAPATAAVPDAPKSAAAMLNLTATLDDGMTQREALLLQGKVIAQLSTAGWSARTTKSSLEFDATQRQTGIVGKVGARTIELCMERPAR
ncbi:MAG: hypothetical protein WBK51_01995 [Polaromonas sp.]